MTGFKEAKLRIELLEAAHNAVLEAARREIHYNKHKYINPEGYNSDQGWRDPEYLKQHLNAQGQKLLRLAQDLAEQIEGLM